MTAGPLLLAVVAAQAAPQPAPASAHVDVGRVAVSFTFSGRELFLFGQAPPETRRVVAVMEGPSLETVRLMEKGRVAVFWLGVHQYSLKDVPSVYLVDVSCPLCNGLASCRHADAVEVANRVLSSGGRTVGPGDVWARSSLSSLSGPLDLGEAKRVVEGFWSLQEKRGLYGLNTNAIRVSPSGAFYHTFTLPAGAPDGRYHVSTYFLSDDRVLGVEENEIFVRKTGVVSWLSRLSERHAVGYGAFAVLIAAIAGWVAGTLFRRGGH